MYDFCQLYKLIITIKNYFACSFSTEHRDCPAFKPKAQHLPTFSVHGEAEASGQCGDGCTSPPLALPKICCCQHLVFFPGEPHLQDWFSFLPSSFPQKLVLCVAFGA